MHRTTHQAWRDHTDREAREAAILTDLTLDLPLGLTLSEATGGDPEPPF